MKLLRRALLLTAAIAALMLPLRASAQSEYIRLHIVADSDSLWDQVIKLCIRDDVRRYTAGLFNDIDSADEAWQLLLAHQEEVLEAVQASSRRYGYHGDIVLQTGVFPFPDRTYGGELIPAGDYRALRITLGEGAGRNWWCVVYPSLCLPETADVDRPVEFYSSIYRWIIRMWEVIRK